MGESIFGVPGEPFDKAGSGFTPITTDYGPLLVETRQMVFFNASRSPVNSNRGSACNEQILFSSFSSWSGKPTEPKQLS